MGEVNIGDKSPNLNPGPAHRQPLLFPTLIMSLSDLKTHIDVQENTISRIAAVLDSNTPTCAMWSPFRKSLWGKGSETFLREERVERDDNPIRAVPILPNAPPPARLVAILPKSLPCGWAYKVKRSWCGPSTKKLRKRLCQPTHPVKVYLWSKDNLGLVRPHPSPLLAESDI